MAMVIFQGQIGSTYWRIGLRISTGTGLLAIGFKLIMFVIMRTKPVTQEATVNIADASIPTIYASLNLALIPEQEDWRKP
jgi:hypothetical protein